MLTARAYPVQKTRPSWSWAVLVSLCLVGQPRPADADIMGGTGNDPIRDPGWPKGAAEVFNVPARVAYWEGPPFGGGEWHAECRGDAAAFNAALAAFAKIDAPHKELVVHDGVAQSFWLNPNREDAKKADATIDWVFVVWQEDRWRLQRRLPAGMRPPNVTDGDKGPVPRIDVYTGGRIRWADVKVPKGVQVVDNRLEAHGFQVTDGTVLEGRITDLATGAPLAGRMELQKVEPQPEGGYRYPRAAQAMADADGRWVLKSAPAGWQRIVVTAAGYLPRVVGYGQFDATPRWSSYPGGLSRLARVAGRVTDEAGRPLADVDVRLDDVAAEPGGGHYESVGEYRFKTDAEGRFASDQLPVGKARVRVHKPGYVRPGLGLEIQLPQEGVTLSMTPAAQVKVTVDFSKSMRPDGYIVEIKPEGGEKIGSWGGAGNLNAEGVIEFKNVPPGRYVLTGRPNPGSESQQTTPQTVELTGGKTTEVTLIAK